jgi:hypothetical protein
LDKFDWGRRRDGKPIQMYKIRLVNGEIIYMASTETLDEVRSHYLGKYLSQGLAISVEELEGENV